MNVRDLGPGTIETADSPHSFAPTDTEAPEPNYGFTGCGVRLVEQAKSGSVVSQGDLLQRCRNYLLLVADRSIDSALRQKVAPSDIVQETFLDARRSFAQFRGSTEAELRNWLRRILKNNVRHAARTFYATNSRDLQRERSIDSWMDPSGALQLPAPDETPSRQVVAGEQRAAVSAALARLPDLQRQVILWRKIDGMSFKEIGILTNRSEEAARKIWVRAIEQLRVELAHCQ